MNIRQVMNYWVRSKGPGPTKGHVVMLDGSIVEVDYLDSYGAYRVIGEIDPDQVAGVIDTGAAKCDISGTWENSVTGHRRYVEAFYDGETVQEMAVRILMDKAKEEKEERELRADPVRYLESILKNRDWTSHFSDDHGVWAAGMAEDRLIGELREKMPQETFDALMAKYAPK